jgi:hypothetical protein
MSNVLGGWNVDVAVGKMPEKVATAFYEVFSKFLGAEYTPIAYLGEQLVSDSLNHAILAEQLLTTGRDTKNVVIIVLNEKEEGFSLVSITPVVEGSEGFGGVKIDVKTDIPADAKVSYDVCMAGFVGSDVEPFALLATQITKGTDYIFAAESKVVAPGTSKKVVLLTTNEMTKSVKFETILG